MKQYECDHVLSTQRAKAAPVESLNPSRLVGLIKEQIITKETKSSLVKIHDLAKSQDLCAFVSVLISHSHTTQYTAHQ